jgi:catechol 2,3-dioxygenase-like lactoylglutathione lyase family enzyme
MAKPSKFAHVVYSTRRFEEMIDWYQNVFEAKVVYQIPRSPSLPTMTSITASRSPTC